MGTLDHMAPKSACAPNIPINSLRSTHFGVPMFHPVHFFPATEDLRQSVEMSKKSVIQIPATDLGLPQSFSNGEDKWV